MLLTNAYKDLCFKMFLTFLDARTWEVMVFVTAQPSRIPAAKLLLQVAGSLGQMTRRKYLQIS